MEKKLLFSILLFVLPLTCVNANAYVEPVQPKSNTLQCDTPPPDSFRITGYGYNFVTLAWTPIAVGDNHYLTVFKENETNGWDSLYSTTIYNSTTYTLNNMQPQKEHRVEIRAVCSNGDPSTISSGVFPNIVYILELTVGGRKPIDPKPINQECSYISFQANEWIGFLLTKPGSDSQDSSLFEFVKVTDPSVKGNIKRVIKDNYVLVAANDYDEWPMNLLDEFRTDFLLFRVGEIKDFVQFDVFGHIDVSFSSNFSNVSLCPSKTNPVLSPYKFEVLTANKVESCLGCPEPTNDNDTKGRMKRDTGFGSIKVQNPINDYLSIFFSKDNFLAGTRTVSLINITGNVVFREQIDIPEPQISIPIDSIFPGFYFLTLEFKGNIQSIKVVKI